MLGFSRVLRAMLRRFSRGYVRFTVTSARNRLVGFRPDYVTPGPQRAQYWTFGLAPSAAAELNIRPGRKQTLPGLIAPFLKGDLLDQAPARLKAPDPRLIGRCFHSIRPDQPISSGARTKTVEVCALRRRHLDLEHTRSYQ